MPNEHTTLTALFTAIANAIRAKTGGSGQIVADTFPSAIAAIETGIQLPTLTNPGSAADLASGKQLIGQTGEIITGTISELNSNNIVHLENGNLPYLDETDIVTRATWTENDEKIIRGTPWIYLKTVASNFGDATAADVAFGKTFTSEVGVKVTGTAAPASYLKGFSATITGNGGNGAWLSYAGQALPLAIFISMYQTISTGNNLFTLLAFGQMGAYTTSNYRAVIEEVSYGTQKTGVLSITQSGSQLHIQLPSNCYFGSGDEYLVGGFYA